MVIKSSALYVLDIRFEGITHSGCLLMVDLLNFNKNYLFFYRIDEIAYGYRNFIFIFF